MKKIVLLLLLALPFIYQVNSDTPGVVASAGPAFTLNPNPVSGSYFYVNLGFAETEFPNVVINITSVLGQVVYTYPIKHTDFVNGNVRIELADTKIDKGVYFVQLKSGDFSKTMKLAVR